MAVVMPEDRRILRDYFGYTDEQIDALPEMHAARHLEAYHSQMGTGTFSRTGEYLGPSPADIEESSDWIAEGLRETAWELGEGFQEVAEKVGTTARQVGENLGQELEFISKLPKYVLIGALILGAVILYGKAT